jgi:hypothetical protein
MYCIRCGAKLSEGQNVCPICNTTVCHPDFVVPDNLSTYPKGDFKSEEFNYRGLLFAITMLCLIQLLLPVLLDIGWSGGITWSGYVFGGVVILYVSVILPFWFKHPNPVVFVPSSFAAIALYLGYICYANEGRWFLTFALPIVAALALIITAMTAVLRYVRRGKLYVFGGVFIALGFWTLLLEHLIRVSFGYNAHFYWSLSSLGICFIIGMLLIIIAIVKPFKESLRRIFYIGKVGKD